MSDDEYEEDPKGGGWKKWNFERVISNKDVPALRGARMCGGDLWRLASGRYENPLELMPRKEHKPHILSHHLITKALIHHQETGKSVVEIKCHRCGNMRKCVVDLKYHLNAWCLYCPFDESSDESWHMPRCPSCIPE